jgi:hypothetical protein
MHNNDLHLQIAGADRATTEPVERYGVLVYVDGDPDIVGCDFKIDPADSKGVSLFREFASRMFEHYKSLIK